MMVYIAAPYSRGDVGQNVHDAMFTWELLFSLGYVPICPHWTHFQHVMFPHPYTKWLEYDRHILAKCDVLLRLEGVSRGADLEVGFAIDQNIPVVRSIQELQERFPVA